MYLKRKNSECSMAEYAILIVTLEVIPMKLE